MVSRLIGALAAVLLAGSPSLAHEAKSQHGGKVTEAGDYHVELVVKGSAVELHLADHDNKPVRAAGHKGLAILAAGGKSQRIVLSPEGEARLTGKAEIELPSAAKGVVQITLPSGKTVQGRFN